MKRDIARHLAPAPPAVRSSMLAADLLDAGAAAVVGRFFEILKRRGEPLDAPSRATFDLAATSESTLATLIRALERHAPQVCLAGGREARKAWYALRPEKGTPRRRGRAPLPPQAPDSWPVEWALLYPGLLRAPIKESSRRRHVDSVNRLAAILPADAEPDWSRFTACALLQALAADGVNARTAKTCLGGLIGLGLHGGVATSKLAALREMRSVAGSRGMRIDKRKVARVAGLDERGGIAAIAEAIGDLRSKAGDLPAWSASSERLRRAAAVLAVEINAFGRTGDVASWKIGRELTREPWGTWSLSWTHEKTGFVQNVGELWDEVGAVLDELILAGRPRRLAELRYAELDGMNWLTFAPEGFAARHPSRLVLETIGLPAHDLRTLVADLLRRVDPARARGLIASMLGHSSALSGEEYRALCEGDFASLQWRRMRGEIAGGALSR